MNWGFLGAALAQAVGGSPAKKTAQARAGNSPLSYTEDGRSGHLHYKQDGVQFAMYYEFGGGNALVLISVPAAAAWEAQTGLPLVQREAVLNSIARQVIADKTSTGRNRYEITDNHITVFEL